MEYTQEKLHELAERIYDLDAEVYTCLGSSLGRVFNRDRERCVTELVQLMKQRDNGHKLRSELALISNMARTIPDKETMSMIMKEYVRILDEVMALPTSFGDGDVLDEEKAKLNALNLKNRFSGDDHLIICISRTQGSAGNEIGFTLADRLRINYYDAEIFSAVLKRLEAEKDYVVDKAGYPEEAMDKANLENAFAKPKKLTLREHFAEFSRYHGLSKRDAIFFNQSDLICDMAKQEDFIVMGRCADMILTNNHIPHVSIFITAPFEQRLQRMMKVHPNLSLKKTKHLLKRFDHQHRYYYRFFTGKEWGMASNYDLCINSASYGIEGSVDFILRMLNREGRKTNTNSNTKSER